ncbi:MAG: hypothetical protein J0L57_07995 [Burkholderiales bacterium]|nr:hypothetical protein [Burkholderiales bacterium]
MNELPNGPGDDPAGLGNIGDAEAVRELVRAAVSAMRTLEYGRRFVNPEEIGTHLDLPKIERELRAALAKLGHPAATMPARSPVAGVGQPNANPAGLAQGGA